MSESLEKQALKKGERNFKALSCDPELYDHNCLNRNSTINWKPDDDC